MATPVLDGVEGPSNDKPATFLVRVTSRAALVEFSKDSRQNPFGQAKMRELGALIRKLDADDSVGCIVLTGGEGRSFSVGGDFKEIESFTGGAEVDTWVDDITYLYTSIASISKPVIAAVDGYAIGLGLQIALCCDYRIGSEVCQLIMPELRMGIACNFGGFMLESLVGRTVMQKMLFTSEKWDAQTSYKDGLLHEVVPSKQLVTRAIERAKVIGSWTSSAVQGTRPNINRSFVDGLYTLGEQAKSSHRGAFAEGKAQVNMNGILTKSHRTATPWILLTNTPIPSLAIVLKDTKKSGVNIYISGATPFLDHFTYADGETNYREQSNWETSIDVNDGIIRMRTANMNNPPLFMVRNSSTGAWAVGTDSFILNLVRFQWGMPVNLAEPAVINRDGTTSFVGVQQLPAHSSFELKKDVGWRLTTEELIDPVEAAFTPQVNDFDQAGSIFVSSLQKAVWEIIEGSDSVGTLLSGGIDSGAVTTFASLAGHKVTAYSAGTPWGNEHNEAKELADFLGIRHVRKDFTAEELLAAVPETMRALGTANHDRVDIALTITAMMRSGIISEKHILTGYGSDLLNMGLPTESDLPEEMMKEIVDGIDATRHSCEFTDFVARARGKRLSHPYWHQDVVQTALNIHPACKIRNGREKAFFRAAMEPFVPMSTAWRRKIGIHQGGGLQDGVEALFGGRDRKIEAYNKCFEALTSRLLADPFAAIDDLAPNPHEIKHESEISIPLEIEIGEALTPSGAGIILRGGKACDLSNLAAVIKREVSRVGFVLAKDLALNEEQFKSFVREIGEPVVHKFKTGQGDLMELKATSEKGKVIMGRGPLPLHTDGILVGKRPDMIILYASKLDVTPGSGETIICDQLKAWEEMPENLRSVLEARQFEYRVEEAGYYQELKDDWFPIPPIRIHDGKTYLNVALQFPQDVERSWSLRVAGVSDTESDAILTALNDFLTQSRYTYHHCWNVGDLLVLDNISTLHGRTSIAENALRLLFRGQVHRRPTDETL